MKSAVAWGLAAAFAAVAAWAEEDTGGRAAMRREVFAYCQRTAWRFDGEGRAVEADAMAAAEAAKEAFAEEGAFDPDGWAAECASGGDPERAAAVRAWLAAEREVPGETVLTAGAAPGGVYVVSERGEASRRLKRYDVAAGRAEAVSPLDGSRELAGPVFLPDGKGGMRLAGLQWRSAEGDRTEWTDPVLREASKRAEAAWPGTGLDWLACAGEDGAGRWIVRARAADRPPVWLEVDAWAAEGGIRVLGECPVAASPTVRRVVRWMASDGAELDGVFTRPRGKGACPLVVFPHGGPGAVSTTDFDERVWALADAGFAVFQPNYRGSTGFGKRFRLDGWGAEGIRRGLLDVREGVAALLSDPEARLDGRPPVLLGGSWGGYIALAQLALFPGDYAGAVSFFGAFDLPALLDEAWQRAGEELPAEAECTRRSLRRQFGDPANDADMAALAALSPIYRLDAIRAPVILFHNRGDRVISFAQSERMAAAMESRGLPVLFRAAEGDHGWAPAEEADLYAALAQVFRGWMEEKAP